jgi:chorismate mutase
MIYAPDIMRGLETFRETIDNIDSAIIHMLAERFRCTQDVGRLKAKQNMPVKDSGREAAQVTRLRSLANGAGLDPDFAERFHAFVVEEVIRQHTAIRMRTDSAI